MIETIPKEICAIPQDWSPAGFGKRRVSLESVELRMLNVYDQICVRTRNSSYRLTLLDPEAGRVLIEGGRFFAEPVEATVLGALFGGFLKLRWIGVGLPLEIRVDGCPFITSPVQSLYVEREIGGDQRRE